MLLRAGDIAIVMLGGVLVGALTIGAWRSPAGDTAVVRAAGEVVQTLSLSQPRRVSVRGPLGTTEIEVAPGRVRVARDPSPRQLCVRQGWLSQAGEAALCLPNQVSVEIRGRDTRYDTLGY